MAEVPASGQRRLLACNERGYRIGESHHNAKLSDALIERLRRLHETEGLGWRRLARMFKLRPWTVKRILDLSERAQVPRSWKRDEHEAEAQEGGETSARATT